MCSSDLLTRECTETPDWIGLFVDRAKALRVASGGRINMGGMVTLLVRSKVDLATLGYYRPIPWDQPPAGGHNYTIQQLKRGKMIHPVKRDGEEFGYLFEFGPAGAEQYIKLPLPVSYGSPTTFSLPRANLVGLEIVGTSARMAKGLNIITKQ